MATRKTRATPTAQPANQPKGPPRVLAQLAGQIGEIARRLVDLERRMKVVDGEDRYRDA